MSSIVNAYTRMFWHSWFHFLVITTLRKMNNFSQVEVVASVSLLAILLQNFTRCGRWLNLQMINFWCSRSYLFIVLSSFITENHGCGGSLTSSWELTFSNQHFGVHILNLSHKVLLLCSCYQRGKNAASSYVFSLFFPSLSLVIKSWSSPPSLLLKLPPSSPTGWPLKKCLRGKNTCATLRSENKVCHVSCHLAFTWNSLNSV